MHFYTSSKYLPGKLAVFSCSGAFADCHCLINNTKCLGETSNFHIYYTIDYCVSNCDICTLYTLIGPFPVPTFRANIPWHIHSVIFRLFFCPKALICLKTSALFHWELSQFVFPYSRYYMIVLLKQKQV